MASEAERARARVLEQLAGAAERVEAGESSEAIAAETSAPPTVGGSALSNEMIPPEKFIVRCKRTHRRGLVDAVVWPPLAGDRELFVIWQGGLDYSVMARHEVVIDPNAKVQNWQQLPPSDLDHAPDGSSMPTREVGSYVDESRDSSSE